MKTYTVLPGQSLADVALSAYADVVGLVDLVNDNPELKGATDRIYAGQILAVKDAALDILTFNFLQDHPVPATITETDLPEGIGFWLLEEYVTQ